MRRRCVARRWALAPVVALVAGGSSLAETPARAATPAAGAGAAASEPSPEPAPGRFAVEANPTWGTSVAGKDDHRVGKVVAMVEAGEHVYFAGEFTGVVPPGTKAGSDEGKLPRRHLVRLDIATGELDRSWDPEPDGPVRALLRSSDGRRVYAGGAFTRIDGQRAGKLVAFDIDTGRLDPEFRVPYVNREVRALAVSPDGRRLYAGGNFSTVEVTAGEGNPRSHRRAQLAAFDARTGALLDWQGPRNAGGQYVQKGHRTSDTGSGAVNALALTPDGDRLYAGGTFLRLGGEGGLVSIDAATGEPTDWQPSDRGCKTGNSTCRPFYDIAISPNDPKTFFAIADGFGGLVGSFTYGKAGRGNWQVRLDGGGMAVVAAPDLVYIGGHFDCIGGRRCAVFRRHLAALDPKTGEIDEHWTPRANTKTGPYSAYLGRDHLYVGGEFSRINNRAQPGFAQFPRR